MEILDLELEDGPFEFDADDDEVIDVMPKGSGPVRIGDTGLETVVQFTRGPLKGYVAVTDLSEWAHLVARSLDEFTKVLQRPANWETPPNEDDGEDGELVGLHDLLDAFADGTRTPTDSAAGEALVDKLPSKDVWSMRYVTQATWGAKLTTSSRAVAQGAIDASGASDSESTPRRWAAEAGREYLSDLDRWASTSD